MIDDDDTGSTEFWRDVKAHKQAKRASNRETSAEALTAAGIPFVSKNGGAHLIVAERYDFWPGTGLWMPIGGGYKHRGVRGLIQRCIGV